MQLIYATRRARKAVSCCCFCSSGASSIRYPKFFFALLNALIENSWSRTEQNDGEQILVSKQIGAQERKNENKRSVVGVGGGVGSDRRWSLVQRLTSGKANNIFFFLHPLATSQHHSGEIWLLRAETIRGALICTGGGDQTGRLAVSSVTAAFMS